MRHTARTMSPAVALTMLACALVAPAGALASKASIRRVIAQASPKIAIVEGHVLTAEGEYTSTKDPAPVAAAIDKSVTVLAALEHKVAAQSAGTPRIKTARSKVVKGLGAIIIGYWHLKSGFEDKAGNQQASEAEVASALASVTKGRKELKAGIALLS
jgi:hypothetical protein